MSIPSSLLPELPVLLVIAEECHFGRAASRLNVSQPRISQVVRRIEDIVGYEIFTRRPQVRLTPAGELLTKAARNVLSELDVALSRAEDAATGRHGIVRLGYAPVAMMTKLPRILNRFHEHNPNVELQLHTTHSRNLWATFEAGQFDLIVSRENRDRPGIRSHLFARDSLVAALPEADPLANSGEISVAALSAREFITSDERIAPSWHNVVLSICRSAGFEPYVAQRTNDWGATLALVASGLGIAMMSSTLAILRFPGVAFVPLKEGRDQGAFWVASRTKATDPIVRVLLTELVKEGCQ
jgi:DNA-binding transcriptional LysR family regulator